MFKNNKIASLFVFLASIFLLVSCDQGKRYKDLHDYIDKLKSADIMRKETNEIANNQNAISVVAVKYESGARRSPFDALEVAPAKDSNPLNPLKAYPLDMLKFVGTVTQNSSTIAFVSTPDNKIFPIKVGDSLGDRDTKVITIESDRISLMEEYSEHGNATMKRVVTLRLKELSR